MNLSTNKNMFEITPLVHGDLKNIFVLFTSKISGSFQWGRSFCYSVSTSRPLYYFRTSFLTKQNGEIQFQLCPIHPRCLRIRASFNQKIDNLALATCWSMTEAIDALYKFAFSVCCTHVSTQI